ncbi:MAG: sulfite exporter TauE/SafE family protein [Patescibacteria group bacterium]
MKKCNINIKGMHCRSCELLIEDELQKVPGIERVSVSHQTGVAELFYRHGFNEQAVAHAIQNAGYSIGVNEKPHIFSRNHWDYVDVGIAFFMVMTVFLLAKTFGLFNLGSSISGSYSSLPIVFIVGLTAGVSTCMAMVGGLVLGAAARFSAQNPNASALEKFKPHLFFNLGRITSYTVLGGVVGFAGSLFQLSTSVLGILTVTVGLVMLLLGGQLIEIFPVLKRISFTLPKGISRILGIKEQTQSEYSDKGAAIMGASTFFLPCGFTQAMQLFAMSTGSPVTGALTMGVFALGTAPGLLSVGGLTSVIKGEAAKMFFKVAGVVVVLLALFNISNGLNLLGIGPNVLGAFNTKAATNTTATDSNVTIANGVQEVRMTQDSSGYTPNSFTIKKGTPVKWIVTSTDVNTCASSIVSQQLGVRQALQLGENIINFTPTETGTIRFSCMMGMYNGSFNVVDETETSAVPSVLAADATPAGVSALPLPSTTTTNAKSSCGGSGGGGCGCGSKRAVPTPNPSQPIAEAVVENNVQVIKATYTSLGDISPNFFIVKANQPVRFEVDAQDNGEGCMGSITVPNLTNKVDILTKGQKTIFEFTPSTPGNYNITCGMGIPRGQIQVI